MATTVEWIIQITAAAPTASGMSYTTHHSYQGIAPYITWRTLDRAGQIHETLSTSTPGQVVAATSMRIGQAIGSGIVQDIVTLNTREGQGIRAARITRRPLDMPAAPTYHEWYAPGIGLVATQSSNGDSCRLVSHHIPEQQPDSPPKRSTVRDIGESRKGIKR